MKTCVIIGGGMGGLVSGALLAKEGYTVTVLEKNAIIGGGLQTFKRHCVSFPTGMHIFGGFSEGGNLRKIFDYLGVTEQIALQPTDDDAFDVVTVGEDGMTYRLPKGKEQMVAYLSTCFPEEREGLKAYFDRLFALSQEEDLFYLRESQTQGAPSFSEDFVRPFNELIDNYITNTKLKGLLGYLSPLFGGVEGVTPAYLNALLSVLHLGGTFQFVGGSLQLAETLKKAIENAGGQVVANAEVERIEVKDHHVSRVMTKDGTAYQADSYVSDVPLFVLMRLVDDGAFPTAFKKRVAEIPETTSSFKVFIKFKDQTFPYLNHASFYLSNYKNTNILQIKHWPQSLMYITPPIEHQGEFAETMVIITEMSFDQVRQWENTCSGHRGKDYENWKQAMTEKVLNRMEKLYPDLRNCIEFVFASSPLTIRDYYGNKEGSNYGFQKDSRNLMLSQMSVTTRVKNLFLTGQNVNIHGLCGVSLTAIETAEALVGRNVIVHKINNFCPNHS